VQSAVAAIGAAFIALERGTLRCEHAVSFLGLRALHFHYRFEEARA
jgi:hypothetical protein